VVIHPHVVVESGVEIGVETEIFAGSILEKASRAFGVTSRRSEFSPRVEIGGHCAIGPHAVVYYDVRIGGSLLIGDGASIRKGCRIGERCLIGRYVTINYSSEIGDRTKIMDLTHITWSCTIGSGVFISVHVSTTNDNVVVGQSYEESRVRGPRIEDEAVIGAGAIILPGVRLGKGCFVAAEAIVTRDVEYEQFVLGAPARPGARR
jgi:acetyltransferase-like isoleucine patch superfamily enzyme